MWWLLPPPLSDDEMLEFIRGGQAESRRESVDCGVEEAEALRTLFLGPNFLRNAVSALACKPSRLAHVPRAHSKT